MSVSIFRDGNGWWFITEEDRTRYYTSLAEVMAAAYARIDRTAARHEVAANGNTVSNYSGFAESGGLLAVR